MEFILASLPCPQGCLLVPTGGEGGLTQQSADGSSPTLPSPAVPRRPPPSPSAGAFARPSSWSCQVTFGFSTLPSQIQARCQRLASATTCSTTARGRNCPGDVPGLDPVRLPLHRRHLRGAWRSCRAVGRLEAKASHLPRSPATIGYRSRRGRCKCRRPREAVRIRGPTQVVTRLLALRRSSAFCLRKAAQAIAHHWLPTA